MSTELTTTPRGGTALTKPGEASPWREAANEEVGASFGTLLKFVKGDWFIGEDKTEVSPTTPFVANMDEVWRGWIKWEDSKPIDHRIGRVIDHFHVPLREKLDDLDKAGESDPWQRVVYLVMRNTSNDEIVTFTSTSDGGKKAVGKLCDLYDRLRHKHPSKMPIVLLESESYQHPEYGKVHKPKFKLIGWDFWDEEAKQNPDGAQQQQRAAEINDEIPF
jgi:hypothetical protein